MMEVASIVQKSNKSPSSEGFNRCIYNKKKSLRDKNKENKIKLKKLRKKSSRGKNTINHVLATGIKSKKLCSGRITVPSDGIFLKGLRSEFAARFPLTEINEARRDENLPRLIDLGTAMLGRKRLNNQSQIPDSAIIGDDEEIIENSKRQNQNESKRNFKSFDRESKQQRTSPDNSHLIAGEIESNNNAAMADDGSCLYERDILRAAASFADGESAQSFTKENDVELFGKLLLSVNFPTSELTRNESLESARGSLEKVVSQQNLSLHISELPQPQSTLSQPSVGFSPAIVSTPNVTPEETETCNNKNENIWITRMAVQERYIKFQKKLEESFKRAKLKCRDDTADRDRLCTYYLKKLRQCNDNHRETQSDENDKDGQKYCRLDTNTYHASSDFQQINRSTGHPAYLITKQSSLNANTADAGVQVSVRNTCTDDFLCNSLDVLSENFVNSYLTNTIDLPNLELNLLGDQIDDFVEPFQVIDTHQSQDDSSSKLDFAYRKRLMF